jgi:hypothetical protein
MSEILLVCGHGRCGSSLTMQMLHAGGYPVVGTWPDYEPFEAGWWSSSAAAEWIAAADGKAFKLLDPQMYAPPKGPAYRCLWLKREPKEQARSAIKLLSRWTPLKPTRRDVAGMAKGYARDTPLAWRELKAAGVSDMLVLHFEKLIRDPRASATALAQWIGRPLDVDAMVRQVAPRPSTCLPFMIEELQLERRARLGLELL